MNSNSTIRSLSNIILLTVITSWSCTGQNTSPIPMDRIDGLILSEMDEKNIPGIAVGVVHNGTVQIAKGYGFANIEDETPLTEHTVFQIGSVTKMLIGHVLASLIDEGVIALDEAVHEAFPDVKPFPESPDGKIITIRELATHTAEFPRYPDNLERIDPDPILGYSKEELKRGIAAVRIDTPVGSQYQYSNFGYGVLGTVLEHRTGRDLASLMNTYVFEPYNMAESALFLDNKLADRLATPYLEVSPHVSTEPWDMGALAGAGNVFSSVSDLNKFIIGMLGTSAVNTIQQQAYFRINETWSYGLGCFVIDSESRNRQIIYHGGDVDGYASSLTLYPEYNFGFVILTNWGEGQIVSKTFTQIDRLLTSIFLEDQD